MITCGMGYDCMRRFLWGRSFARIRKQPMPYCATLKGACRPPKTILDQDITDHFSMIDIEPLPARDFKFPGLYPQKVQDSGMQIRYVVAVS